MDPLAFNAYGGQVASCDADALKDAERWRFCLADPNLAALIMYESTNPDTKAGNIAAYITFAIDAEIERTADLKSPQ